MKRKKQAIAVIVAAAILAALVYLQFRQWQQFDWRAFKAGTSGINWWLVLWGVLMVHVADFLRALRWKVFLRPSRPKVPWTSLIAPQFVGFAGLAILGRPGELIRPYLIAKRADTPVTAQVAVWFVERAFDITSVTIIVAADIFFVLPPHLRQQWQTAGYILIAFSAAFVVALYALWKQGPAIADFACRLITPISGNIAGKVGRKLRTASGALHTIHDWQSFFEASLISGIIWILVSVAYREVSLAFPAHTGLHALGIPEVILLMGASVAGGVLQLPVVGGGAQLASIAVLSSSFHDVVRPELAVAAGILYWLVTFVSVAPIGLVLARFEHVSLRKVAQEPEPNGDLLETDAAN
ncbi:MAG TPA: lysylphosphatidylglycerol synthase transmembrane domain-containing protein [Terriglobales bacterium]|nr:lysylphosphatidylglycerol synthase transmembrane domain-containing protein [Terriglobales bacterium]